MYYYYYYYHLPFDTWEDLVQSYSDAHIINPNQTYNPNDIKFQDLNILNCN
jgi:hypothetical protein